MNKTALRFLVAVTLCGSASSAHGQRLTPALPSVSAASFASSASSPALASRRDYGSHYCRYSPAVLIGGGALAGAAAGWLAYELSLGIWVAGEGGTPDATVRRIRTTLIATGVVVGVWQAVRISRECRA